MKKVTGYISIGSLGYDFKFFVPDDTPDEEIKRMAIEKMNFRYDDDIEVDYEEYTEVQYP